MGGTGMQQHDGARRTGPVRRAVAGAAGLLLVIGASTIGLHDWADDHLVAKPDATTQQPQA